MKLTKDDLLKEIKTIREAETYEQVSRDALCAYINNTPALLSLLYDLDLLPEQCMSCADKIKQHIMWREMSLIAIAFCLFEDEVTHRL